MNGSGWVRTIRNALVLRSFFQEAIWYPLQAIGRRLLIVVPQIKECGSSQGATVLDSAEADDRGITIRDLVFKSLSNLIE